MLAAYCEQNRKFYRLSQICNLDPTIKGKNEMLQNREMKLQNKLVTRVKCHGQGISLADTSALLVINLQESLFKSASSYIPCG